MSEDDIEAWSVLVTVYQSVLHDVVGALERDAGIDSGVFSALAYLERAEPRGRLPLQELQRLMHPRYSQPGLSRLVQRMEAAGFVERRADPNDKRAALVVTTHAGRTRFERANGVYVAGVRDAFLAHLGPAEAARLTNDLANVVTRRARTATVPR